MSDIKNIKMTINSARTDFRAQLTFGGEAVLSKADLLSLITTIESQKEEIEQLKFNLDIHVKAVNVEYESQSQIESLKAITELAVKGLRRIVDIESEPHKPCLKCSNKGYHHGFGSDGHDPDYCADCGGLGEIYVGQTEVAMDTLSEIERLSQ